MSAKQNLAVVPPPGQPGKPPVITRDLMKLENVAREMAKIYRATRRGELPSQEGTRLTYILRQLGDMLELVDLEQRVEALERQRGG